MKTVIPFLAAFSICFAGFSFTNCDTLFSVNYRFRSVESYKFVAYEEI